MYVTIPPAVPLADPSPFRKGPDPLRSGPFRAYSPAHRAELLASLEAERIPNGSAFTWCPEAPELDDSLPTVAARRRALLDALDAPSPAVYGRNAPRLRVVA
jgi:hypothetical protein